MKKLTAGIFATILGLTTVNAFAATAGTKVASTNYVDGAVAAANEYTDQKVGGIETDLAGYVKTGDFGEFKTENTAAIATAKSEAIADAATAAAGLYETKESAKAYETKANASATYATKDEIKDMATSGQITGLDTRVGAIEADYLKTAAIADMATKTQVAQDIAAATTNMATTGDVATAQQAAIDAAATAAAGLYETKESAKAYETKANASATYATKTSVSTVEGRLSAQEGAITAIRNTVDLKANSADVYTKTVADTTFVKVSDIVDTYPATQAAQQ